MAAELKFEHRPKFILAISDSLIMIVRSSRHILRNTDQLLGTFFQPIMFLVLFVAVFGGAISKSLPPGVTYLQFLLAGIIVQTVAFGSTTTATAICSDLQKGIVDRFRSLPMNNLAVLTGHVVSDVFRNGISTIVMLVVGVLLGFRSNASLEEWLLIGLILLTFTLAFSWLAAIVGLVAKSIESVQWLTFVIVFPLTFASSAFVPTEGMNTVLRTFAQNQPITQVVNAVRGLFLNIPSAHYVWLSFAWCLGSMIITIPLAAYLFKRKANQ